MSEGERVVEGLDAGYNCAEAMVSAFSEAVGAPPALCRVATPFGGGVARTGSTCGLVSGAVMVLGWALGREDSSDLMTKERAYDAVAGLIRDVEAACGSTSCKDILGADLSTDKGRTLADSSECRRRCREAARRIARLLEARLAKPGRLGAHDPPPATPAEERNVR
jgi:C_GCAxxG_C_C family probable redox protein